MFPNIYFMTYGNAHKVSLPLDHLDQVPHGVGEWAVDHDRVETLPMDFHIMGIVMDEVLP